ncbi:sialidase family protein [Kribbella qitaiheensis]|uniref:sialidase family protein n=1 Tax=Kribbella qitaiheensis TaxID=1544730 RepID=UPI003623B2EF
MTRVVVAQAAEGELAYFPSAVLLGDGRVLVAWREGEGHVRSGGRLVMAESGDGGESWSEPRVVVDGRWDDRDPMVVQLRGGDVLLSWFQIDWGVSPYECPGVLVARSEDGGTTWGDPVVVESRMVAETDEVWHGFRAGHVVAHGQILELPDGDLLAPIYGVFPGDACHSASVVRSTDGGRTWPAAGEVVLGRKRGREYLEPVLTLLPGGQVVALLRTDDEAELVRSDDNGFTWTEPEPSGLHASSSDTLTLSDGAVLVAYGDVSGQFNPGRPTVATVVTEPLGRWDQDPQYVVLDAGQDTVDQANPAVVELPGERLLIISYDIFTREIVGEVLPRERINPVRAATGGRHP